MRILIAAVGRPRDQALGAAIRDYEVRAERYWPLRVVEVRAARAHGDASVVAVREVEGERLLAASGTSGLLVACDAGGRSMTSEQFASWLTGLRESASDVSFALGGAFGLSAALLGRAHLTLALAPWTLPHELARLVLTEQLYRAGTIARGEPYHK